MRLIRLKIESWRGVATREITFGDGVTVIEGPNEIGKSSMFEALQLLFTELDSTSKVAVKAVQPVGQDQGSQVQAEFTSGPYHAVYTKRFNRQKSTSLELYAPRRETLTGREAHERAAQLLDETMDVALWRALQVTQGGEVSQALIKDSRGLAKALDAAAGEQAGETGGGLFERVEQVYQSYFTPRTGNPRGTDDEALLERLQARLETLQGELKTAESDLERHQQLTDQAARLTAELPGHRASLDSLSERLRALTNLEYRRDTAQDLLREARLRSDGLQRDLQRRAGLQERVRASIREVTLDRENLAASKDRIAGLEEACRQARGARQAALQQHGAAVESAAQSEQLVSWLRERRELMHLQRMAAQLEEAEAQISQAQARLERAGITPEQYRCLEQIDNEWRQARAVLDMGSPTLRVVAGEEGLEVGFGEESSVKLDPGGSISRITPEDTVVQIGRIARIEVCPGSSLSDLQGAEVRLRTSRERLMGELGVASLSQAAIGLEDRLLAEQTLNTGRERRDGILSGTTRERLSQELRQLEARAGQPPSDSTADPGQAEQAYREAQQALQQAAAGLERSRSEEARSAEEKIRAEADESVLASRLQAAVHRRQGLERELAELREQCADRELADSIAATDAVAAARSADLDELTEQLRVQDPESLRLLHENALQVWQSANDQLGEINERLAVVSDRLERAQVAGLFEQLSKAQSDRDAQLRVVQDRRQRAAAARRLYTTLDRHRTAARKAYVAPLKKQIDALGRLVFGVEFDSELDDSLRVTARNLDGKILPFEELSVGAREQLGILMRLAAARLVAVDGGVPLILDDTLGYSDPQRLASMGAALSVAGRETQILILTCTPGRFQHVGGAQLIRLEDV